MKKLIIFFFLFIKFSLSYANIVPRTVIALYDSHSNDLSFTRLHQIAEMPLNHLGLTLEYHDINKPLPNIKNRQDILGMISWFESGTVLNAPLTYISWLKSAMDNGKKLVILGDAGFINTLPSQKPITKSQINEIFGRLGLYYSDQWVDLTYQSKIMSENKQAMGYESNLPLIIPAYYKILSINPHNKVHLSLAEFGNKKLISDIIVSGSEGGYAQDGFFFHHTYNALADKDNRSWILNPFIFFKNAFQTNNIPKPDTTTLAGMRIYYSHIDGDGWNNFSSIKSPAQKLQLSSKIILDNIFKEFPYLPATVGAIAADLDPEWVGSIEAQEVAKKIYALPNISVASHTYSHPFDWDFFENYTPKKEFPYIKKYHDGTWLDKKQNRIDLDKYARGETAPRTHSHNDYDRPRAFANKPFDLNNEIVGSLDYINGFAPENKAGKMILWSGNTLAFEAALKLADQQGISNINGGDSRYDEEFPSVSWVYPIGRAVGTFHQIYSSGSNENTYTVIHDPLPKKSYNTWVA